MRKGASAPESGASEPSGGSMPGASFVLAVKQAVKQFKYTPKPQSVKAEVRHDTTSQTARPGARRAAAQASRSIPLRDYSYRTEESYVSWIKRFILFHHKRHPQDMGSTEVQAFLTHLAVEQRVAASTQNQALSALLFLYREVLHLA